MQQLKKSVRLIGLVMFLLICFTTINVNAQSPADDPGIGGVGSPTGGGLTGDGGPVVPFDNRMSLFLLLGGIVYASKRVFGIKDSAFQSH